MLSEAGGGLLVLILIVFPVGTVCLAGMADNWAGGLSIRAVHRMQARFERVMIEGRPVPQLITELERRDDSVVWFLRTLIVIGINIAAGLLFWYNIKEVTVFGLVLLVLLVLEASFIFWERRRNRRAYQSDFKRCMRLSDRKVGCVVGHLTYDGESEFASVMLEKRTVRLRVSHQQRRAWLFVSQPFEHRVRVYYKDLT